MSTYSELFEEPVKPEKIQQEIIKGDWTGTASHKFGFTSSPVKLTLDSTGAVVGTVDSADSGLWAVTGTMKVIDTVLGTIDVDLTCVNASGGLAAMKMVATIERNEVGTWSLKGETAMFKLVLAGGQTATRADFPALYTNTDLMTRIQAVAGGIALARELGATRAEAFEGATFNGTVWRPDGSISDFRGFNLDFDPVKYNFDAIDHLWYSRRGRILLARGALAAFGYAQVNDLSAYNPPYPILNGRFLGLLDALAARPLTAQFGYWPSSVNTGARAVTPFGNDTDLDGPNQIAGIPIHITLPVAEPILRDNGDVSCSLEKVGAAPTVPATWKFFQAYSNVIGLVVPNSQAGANFYAARGTPAPLIADAAVTAITTLASLPGDRFRTSFALESAPDLAKIVVGDQLQLRILRGTRAGTYRYAIISVDTSSNEVIVDIFQPAITPADYANDLRNVRVDLFSRTNTGIVAKVDPFLRDGEFLMVPVAPLETNARYRVTLRLRTVSYDTGNLTWEFETNDKAAQ
jgi:hypothetical protein